MKAFLRIHVLDNLELKHFLAVFLCLFVLRHHFFQEPAKDLTALAAVTMASEASIRVVANVELAVHDFGPLLDLVNYVVWLLWLVALEA